MYSTGVTLVFTDATISPHVHSPTHHHVAIRSGTLDNSIDNLPSALFSDCRWTVWEDWLWQNGLLCYWLQLRKCCVLLSPPPPSFHSQDPAGPQPQPTISLIALLQETHLSKVTGLGGGGGCQRPLGCQTSLSCIVSYLLGWTTSEVLYCWRLQVHRHQTFDAVLAALID